MNLAETFFHRLLRAAEVLHDQHRGAVAASHGDRFTAEAFELNELTAIDKIRQRGGLTTESDENVCGDVRMIGATGKIAASGEV